MNNNKYPHKIRKLCGSKSIMKNTISQLPMEYIKSEEEDNSVLTAKIAESIKSRGMLSPIVVYKESKNTFKIIDGRRRYLAAEMLEREYIECLILSCGESHVSRKQIEQTVRRQIKYCRIQLSRVSLMCRS